MGESVTFQHLLEEECYRLLKSHNFGHLGIVKEGYPLIFPLNYGMDNESIVIRTSRGTKFDHTMGHRVAFEVEEVDQALKRAWSVMIKGRAFHSEIEGMAHPQSLAPGEKPSIIRIAIEEISGRRIAKSEDIEFDGRGYL